MNETEKSAYEEARQDGGSAAKVMRRESGWS